MSEIGSVVNTFYSMT